MLKTKLGESKSYTQSASMNSYNASEEHIVSSHALNRKLIVAKIRNLHALPAFAIKSDPEHGEVQGRFENNLFSSTRVNYKQAA